MDLAKAGVTKSLISKSLWPQRCKTLKKTPKNNSVEWVYAKPKKDLHQADFSK